jgi:hypothetical protein
LISLAFLYLRSPDFGRCYHFATEGLSRLRLYLARDRKVNLFHRVRLHSWHDMGIEVERDADRRMPKPFAGNLRIGAANGICDA